MARSRGSLDRFTFGGRVPAAVGLLLATTVGASLVTALGSHVVPLFDLGALVPERVVAGQLWRLLTWSFLEPSPLALLFSSLLLYWFGRDLTEEWGSRRMLLVYFGISGAAAIATCLLAAALPSVAQSRYVGTWPLAEALTIAWGLTFPDRVVRLYFFIPVRGQMLALATVGITVVLAIYSGARGYVPHLAAQAAMFAFLFRSSVVVRVRAWRKVRATQARARASQRKQKGQLASVHVLRAIEARDDELPPLPPELEQKLGRIFEEAGKNPPRKNSDDDGNKPS